MIHLENYEHLNEALLKFNQELIELYRNSLKGNDRIASKHLYNDITTDIDIDGELINLTIELNDYWKYVDNGRNKGKFPPSNAIEKWIKDKNIVPRADKNGKLPTQKQLIYLIGRKISREGYEGSEDLKQSVDILKKKFETIFQEALEKDFSELIVQDINLL